MGEKQKNHIEKKPKKKKYKFKGIVDWNGCDSWFLIISAILVVFGLIMIFSASYYYSISEYGFAYSYLLKHTIWILTGTIFAIVAMKIDYHIYAKYANRGIILCVVLLLLIFTPLGHSANNATRWIGAGPLTIMPGEWAKLFLIIFVAKYFSDNPKLISSLKKGILPVVAITMVIALLIIKQPNLSTAITICGIVLSMMLVAGMTWKFLFAGVGLGFAGIFYIVVFMKDSYWNQRLTSFLDPFANALGEGYQAVQSLLALGSGGLFGVGLGKGVQKNLYLPEPQNDFILAVIGEELGFIGIVLLLVVYILFLWRGALITINAPDQFGLLVGSGIVLMVGIQVIFNIAVVTSSMPPTGINLPFISYGGNSIWMFMIAVGIMLNISMQGKKASRRETYLGEIK